MSNLFEWMLTFFLEEPPVFINSRYKPGKKEAQLLWFFGKKLLQISGREAEKEKRLRCVRLANDVLSRALELKEDEPKFHRYKAIAIEAMGEHVSTAERIRNLSHEKKHLERALEIRPDDYISLTLMGKLCCTICRIPESHKFLIRIFLAKLPEASYEEAYACFLKAEKVTGDKYIPNLYNLAETCYYMGNFEKSLYYIKRIETLIAETPLDERCKTKAGELKRRMSLFSLGSNRDDVNK